MRDRFKIGSAHQFSAIAVIKLPRTTCIFCLFFFFCEHEWPRTKLSMFVGEVGEARRTINSLSIPGRMSRRKHGNRLVSRPSEYMRYGNQPTVLITIKDEDDGLLRLNPNSTQRNTEKPTALFEQIDTNRSVMTSVCGRKFRTGCQLGVGSTDLQIFFPKTVAPRVHWALGPDR